MTRTRVISGVAAVAVLAAMVWLAIGGDGDGSVEPTPATWPRVEQVDVLCEPISSDAGLLPPDIWVVSPADATGDDQIAVEPQMGGWPTVLVDRGDFGDAVCGPEEDVPQVRWCETAAATTWAGELTDDDLELPADFPVDVVREDGGRAFVWIAGDGWGSVRADAVDCSPLGWSLLPGVGERMAVCQPVHGVSSGDDVASVETVPAGATVAIRHVVGSDDGTRDVLVSIVDGVPDRFGDRLWTTRAEIQRVLQECPAAA